MRFLPARRLHRWLVLAGGAAVAIVLILLLGLAAFPLGRLKGPIEARLSERFGRPATITAIERKEFFSFNPTITVRGIRIPQPVWAGEGNLASIDRAEIRFPLLPLLGGRFAPESLVVSGARIMLVRARDGRENWKDSRRTDDNGAGGDPTLRHLRIVNTQLRYQDAKQDRMFAVGVVATERGLAASGRGMVRGAPVAIRFNGGAVLASDAAWPFSATIDGPSLGMQAKGTMAGPFGTDRMSLDVTARASDLKLIDAVIEAGLFRTQPVTLRAHVERTRPKWAIRNLAGTIGRSRFSGKLDVDKVDGRTKLDGDIVAAQLDFDDLASDEGLAKSAALERRIGPRVVPNTQIDIGKIDSTDGRIAFRIARIVSRTGPASVREARGVLTLDDRILTVAPFSIVLPEGRITGRAVIDQRDGAPAPKATFDVRLTGATLAGLGGGSVPVSGKLAARGYLVGRGETIRAAIARSTGRLGLVARDGDLPERYAAALGFDAGRALLAKKDKRTGLRCIVAEVAMRNGNGRIDPMVIDTTESAMRGTGGITFPDERLSVTLTGAPKHDAILRVPGSAMVTGTLSDPHLEVPKEVRSAGNIFKAIGRAVRGRSGPLASDADCSGMAAKALR